MQECAKISFHKVNMIFEGSTKGIEPTGNHGSYAQIQNSDFNQVSFPPSKTLIDVHHPLLKTAEHYSLNGQ